MRIGGGWSKRTGGRGGGMGSQLALWKGGSKVGREISNSDDVIDSRDVIKRIEELADQVVWRVISTSEKDDETGEALYWSNSDGWVDRASADTFQEDEQKAFGLPAGGTWECDLCEDELAELATLKVLESEAEGYAEDWRHGVGLIRDSYFEDYARELAEDIGAIKDDAQWPNSCIDWEQAARELRMDYTSVEFDGVTYWVR